MTTAVEARSEVEEQIVSEMAEQYVNESAADASRGRSGAAVARRAKRTEDKRLEVVATIFACDESRLKDG